MGRGPVIRGQQQPITRYTGSWAQQAAAGQSSAALRENDARDKAARGVGLGLFSTSIFGPFRRNEQCGDK